MAKKKAALKPPVHPRIPVDLKAEEVRGTDGWRILLGQVVRCPSYLSPALRVQVPTRTGVVVSAYRRVEGGPVVLELRQDRDTCAGGLTAVLAERCKGSKATIRGTTAADWHGKR